MLLFIIFLILSALPLTRFQYISCCYLSRKAEEAARREEEVSIHLMLLFIIRNRIWFRGDSKFQYISCCYLSQDIRLDDGLMNVFQYISCCYLSCTGWHQHRSSIHVSIHLMLLFIGSGGGFVASASLFQYISCCYLSRTGCKA